MPIFDWTGDLNPEKRKVEKFSSEIDLCIKNINNYLDDLSRNWISDESEKEMPKLTSCMDELKSANNSCIATVSEELNNMEKALQSLGAGSGSN